jgi:hypothetical protein
VWVPLKSAQEIPEFLGVHLEDFSRNSRISWRSGPEFPSRNAGISSHLSRVLAALKSGNSGISWRQTSGHVASRASEILEFLDRSSGSKPRNSGISSMSPSERRTIQNPEILEFLRSLSISHPGNSGISYSRSPTTLVAWSKQSQVLPRQKFWNFLTDRAVRSHERQTQA